MPGQPLSGLVLSVRNDFPVSPLLPGFRWRARRLPSRFCAGTQCPLAPRPSGVHFRFVQSAAGLGGQVAARKATGRVLGGRGVVAPASRACTRLGPASCAVQPAHGVFSPSASSSRAALVGFGRYWPAGNRPQRAARGVPAPRAADPETLPGLALSLLSQRKQQRVYAPESSRREDTPPQVLESPGLARGGLMGGQGSGLGGLLRA